MDLGVEEQWDLGRGRRHTAGKGGCSWGDAELRVHRSRVNDALRSGENHSKRFRVRGVKGQTPSQRNCCCVLPDGPPELCDLRITRQQYSCYSTRANKFPELLLLTERADILIILLIFLMSRGHKYSRDARPCVHLIPVRFCDFTWNTFLIFFFSH